MRTHSLTHLADAALDRDLEATVGRARTVTAWELAHIAESDARRRYAALGYPSMRAYCVERLRYSEDAASKRIQVARVARQFPAIFSALAESRVHLTGLNVLAPHLTAANVDGLLAAATHRTKAEIEVLVAQRFPRTEVMPWVQRLPAAPGHAPAHVDCKADGVTGTTEHAPAHVETSVPRPKVEPLATERFAIQFTIGRETNDLLQQAQELLSHTVPSGDLATVFHRALEVLVPRLEKQRFAATSKPRPRSCRTSMDPRHIPACVKRTVWERDGGQCSFVGDHGHRCSARKFLEFDHADPLARGGLATVQNLRLRCRTHNQFEAERVFGAEFMKAKREARRLVADDESRSVAHDDVIACLRELGCRADEAQRAIERSGAAPEAPLEERVRAALRFVGPKTRSPSRPGPGSRPPITHEADSSRIASAPIT